MTRFIIKYNEKHICIITVLLLLTSCASICDSTKECLSIRSEPYDAEVIIRDNKGLEVYSGTTPADITLPKSVGYFCGADYLITVSKPGYESKSITVTRSLSGWYWGNILIGGLIGMLIIDPATGAMWTLEDDLPVVNLPRLSCKHDNEIGNNMKLQILTIDKLQETNKQKLILLEGNDD